MKFGDGEREIALAQMEAYGENADEPKVGIFWYDDKKHELFDVRNIPAEDSQTNKKIGAYGNTISILHRDVWKKNKHRDLAKNVKSKYTKFKFTDIARGRVFEKNGIFIIAAGSYMNESIKQLVIEEFDLQNQQIELLIDEHWEIGNDEPFL